MTVLSEVASAPLIARNHQGSRGVAASTIFTIEYEENAIIVIPTVSRTSHFDSHNLLPMPDGKQNRNNRKW